MARKPVVRAKDKAALLDALDHVHVVSGGVADYAQYCLFAPGWLIGYDGVVASGFRAAESLGIAPETEALRTALARAGNPYSLTVLASGKLALRGESVRVEINCYPAAHIPNAQPDAPLGAVNEAFRTSLLAVGEIAAARSDRVIGSSVYLKQQSCVATDGGTILEGYHGCNLPSAWLLPKEFIVALGKIRRMPTHIGWGETTFTVWFGPDAWLRTNVYDERYPDTDLIFAKMVADCGNEFRPIPEIMAVALETLKGFLHGEFIHLRSYGFNTQPDNSGNAYSFEHHLTSERAIPYTGARYAAAYGQWLAFCKAGFYWYGPQLRGITAAEEV